MRYCIKCNMIYTNCCCNQTVSSVTNIISDQAGRDGLSVKQIAINMGKFPVDGTDEEFLEWSKGPKGDKGDPGLSGQSEYEFTDW